MSTARTTGGIVPVTPAVAIRGLTVIRGGRPALRDVSVDVRPGRVTGLLGPSGCGKTTLLRTIVGVQRIASGAVEVLGQAAGAPALRAQVGYVTQAPAVYGDLTVFENLRYFARILTVPAARVDAVLETVGLIGVARDRVDRLSGGQRARVSLASALLHEPPLLVLDEPTVGLDPLLRRELWDEFHRLAAAGATLLVSSHVMDEADRCDELILMRDGAVLATGSPAELRERTAAPTIEGAFIALVGAPEPGA